MFTYPIFRPRLNLGKPILDPGVPAGDNRLGNGVHAIPWPSVTGYLRITRSWIGAYAPPPVGPVNVRPIMERNRYSGIIAGIFKK